MTYIRNLEVNRNFGKVNQKFCLELGDEIQKRIQTQPEVKVLDVACGTTAVAITELTNLYPKLKGIGSNYELPYEDIKSGGGLLIVKGDLDDMPFKPEADVSYCVFTLPAIISHTIEYYEDRIAHAVYNIASTLKKGGIAFIDEPAFASYDLNINQLVEKISEKHPNFSKEFTIRNNPDIGFVGNYLVVNRNDK